MTSQSIKNVLAKTRTKLEGISDSPDLDAELLLAHCLGKNRTYLHTWPEQQVTDSQLSQFQSLIQQREDDYPVAYMLGSKAFWTFELTVSPDVLIPRPETELLVEIALEKIKDISNPKILDLGTGSGAIALALASERKDAIVVASDNSEKALNIAKINAKKFGLEEQINFQYSAWFANLTEKGFDLIVSNPPYIACDDQYLEKTTRHEPQSALISENEGLQDIDNIIRGSTRFIKDNSWVILEHGFEQGKQTQQLFLKHGYTDEVTQKDINQNPRVTYARYTIKD